MLLAPHQGKLRSAPAAGDGQPDLDLAWGSSLAEAERAAAGQVCLQVRTISASLTSFEENGGWFEGARWQAMLLDDSERERLQEKRGSAEGRRKGAKEEWSGTTFSWNNKKKQHTDLECWTWRAYIDGGKGTASPAGSKSCSATAAASVVLTGSSEPLRLRRAQLAVGML